MTNDIKSATCLDLVRFLVSEYIYVCHKSTILRYPNSKLAELIKPENDKRQSGLDHIVLNRNGKIFGIILKLMKDRRDDGWRDLGETELNDLMKDLDFFHLSDLKRSIKTKDDKLDVRILESIVSDCEWQDLIKQLLAMGKFRIVIHGLDYRKQAGLNRKPEIFRFFAPDEGLPRLSRGDDPNSAQYGDLLHESPISYKNSKESFFRFLIAIEMYIKSRSPAELLIIEEHIPGTKFKRYQANKWISKTEENTN